MSLLWLRKGCATLVAAFAFLSVATPLASAIALPPARVTWTAPSVHGVYLRSFGVVVIPNRIQPKRTSALTLTVLRDFLTSRLALVDSTASPLSSRLTATYGRISENNFPGSKAAAPYMGWLVAERGTAIINMGNPVGFGSAKSFAATHCTTYGLFDATTSRWQGSLQSCGR